MADKEYQWFDDCWMFTISDRLQIGDKLWSKKQVRRMLARRHGTFFCVARYEWRIRRGVLSYNIDGCEETFTVRREALATIRKWARSK